MKILLVIAAIIVIGCHNADSSKAIDAIVSHQDTIKSDTTSTVGGIKPAQTFAGKKIETGTTTPDEVLAFAKTLIGTPYLYGSIDPKNGFDCSGFITYVFNHFNISVPRSSKDFTNVERPVSIDEAKPGDIVLFTGTDSTIRDVGHMGIITGKTNEIVEFIHSTSGKAHGVTITPLNKYYMGRFVKVLRLFRVND